MAFSLAIILLFALPTNKIFFPFHSNGMLLLWYGDGCSPGDANSGVFPGSLLFYSWVPI
jgi:hypothetical protein